MKILYITPYHLFRKAQDGGEQCAQRNYRAIRQIFGDENVQTCVFENDNSDIPNGVKVFKRAESKIEKILATLQMRRIYLKNEEKEIENFIKKSNADIVFVERSLLGSLLGCVPSSMKTVVFFHNIEKLYTFNQFKHDGVQFFPVYLAAAKNEKAVINKANAIICLNERDNKMLNTVYNRSANVLWPITFKDSFDEKRMSESVATKDLLFIGSLFTPNLDGISWFIKEVMPLLPDFKLHVVGKNFETVKSQLESECVEVIGTVDDLSDYYYKYPAQVLPIRYGDGMKVKTAEAMMYGKIMFASSEALEGYDVKGVDGIYRCDSPLEYANAIKRFFDAEVKTKTWSADVRKAFLNKYEDEAQNQKIADFFKKL